MAERHLRGYSKCDQVTINIIPNDDMIPTSGCDTNDYIKENLSSYENVSSINSAYQTDEATQTDQQVSTANNDNITMYNKIAINNNQSSKLLPTTTTTFPVGENTTCDKTAAMCQKKLYKRQNNSEASNSDNSPSLPHNKLQLSQRQRSQKYRQKTAWTVDENAANKKPLDSNMTADDVGDGRNSLANICDRSAVPMKLTTYNLLELPHSSGEASQTEADMYVGLEENLNSLDRTIKKCYMQLSKKSKKESTNNYVPNTSVGRMTCKSPLRTEKVLVYLRVVFLKIGEIDTMKENFTADAFIQARWREPSLDGKTEQNPDDMDWGTFWNPKIYIENCFSEPKETVWQTLSFNAKQEATVFERRRIRGCFIENLELDEFPFDTQDLTLTITTERTEMELELEEDTDEISSINVQSFVDEQEWELHSHVETWKKITTKAYQNSKAKHPSFSTSCRATRRPGFFIWNIFLVMLFICSLTFATFCVDLMKPENRLQLSFILLLTTITFKFVVSQTLPRISYLTYLDKYILISMGILCGVCVWHAVVFSFFRHNRDLARTVDQWALIISGSSYFLFHVLFFSCIYFVSLKKRWKYDLKDKEHKERIKRLQRLQELTKTNFADEENVIGSDVTQRNNSKSC